MTRYHAHRPAHSFGAELRAEVRATRLRDVLWGTVLLVEIALILIVGLSTGPVA